MKEYKVVRQKAGISKWQENFEILLNKHARQGWSLKFVSQKWTMIIFERDKNR